MSGTVSQMPGGLFKNEEWISSDVRPHGEEVQVPFSCNHQLKQQPKPGGFIFQVLKPSAGQNIRLAQSPRNATLVQSGIWGPTAFLNVFWGQPDDCLVLVLLRMPRHNITSQN